MDSHLRGNDKEYIMLNLIDKKIRQSFSDAALQYDVLTSMHQEIGRELVKKVLDEKANRILDIGMGTGRMTRALSFYFPESKVVGMDFADQMIAVAKAKCEKHFIVQANARALPFKKESFDLIVSNLAFQWMDNLEDAFQRCYEQLNADGVICLTMFGRETFRELFEAMEYAHQEMNTKGTIRRLFSFDEAKSMMERTQFKNITMDYERIKTHFPDVKALLEWIKKTGANGLSRDFYFGKDFLEKVTEYYEQKHTDRLGICATLEVIWIKAKR